MRPFKIASWNVNSLRARLPHVLDWLEKNQPDVLALQELKLEDKDFPVEVFKALNYQVSFSGQKAYNGVGIISKYDILAPEMPDQDEQRRILAVSINNIRIINIYVPNGEAVGTAKYKYKLNWLKNLKDYLKSELIKYPKLIILGDFNIAPTDEDVYEPDLWRDKILCSEAERAALRELENLGLWDSFRLFDQPPKIFSWWDYRTAGFRGNRGLRIDLILASEGLKNQCESASIDSAPRAWERPSDHAPVVLSLRLV